MSEHLSSVLFTSMAISLMHIIDSRQFRTMLHILLKHVWPRNEIAITVPSILFTPGWMNAFCCMVGVRENLFSEVFSKNWENLGFVSWQEGGTSSITKSFCHTMLSKLYLSLCAEGHRSLLPINVIENFRKRNCINFECICVKRSFTMRKRQQILEYTSITTTSMLSFWQLLPPNCPLVWFLNGTAKYRTQVLCYWW